MEAHDARREGMTEGKSRTKKGKRAPDQNTGARCDTLTKHVAYDFSCEFSADQKPIVYITRAERPGA
jgi:hypothetical protein